MYVIIIKEASQMKHLHTFLFLVFSIILPRVTFAQPWTLLKDINPTGDSYADFIQEWNVAGSNNLFIADDGVHGYELWTTDGTAAGTKLVKDINPSGDAFIGTSFAMLNNVLYFFADDGVHGAELWKTDGTAAGTALVKDIFPTIVQYYPDQTNLVTIGNNIYFLANDGTHGREIWKTDGTSAGTAMLADLNVTGDFVLNNNLNTLYVLNNQLLINGSIGSQTGLWKVSTAGAAVFLLAFNSPGNISGFVFHGNFYFSLFNSGYKLYTTDGTAIGSVLVKNILWNSTTVVYNNDCYFLGDNNDNQATTNLWKINHTDMSIELVKKISDKQTQYSNLVVVNNKILFYANDNTNGYVWLKSDGTAAGTTQLYDFTTTLVNSSDLYSYNYVFNNELYLVAEYGTSDFALYKTNGITVDFVQNFIISNVLGDLWSFGMINNKLYLSAENADTGLELYSPEQTTTAVFSSKNHSLNIYIYPNPFIDVLHVDIKDNQFYTYELIDLNGLSIQAGALTGNLTNAIVTDKLHAGIYMVVIYENGSVKGSYKVIK